MSINGTAKTHVADASAAVTSPLDWIDSQRERLVDGGAQNHEAIRTVHVTNFNVRVWRHPVHEVEISFKMTTKLLPATRIMKQKQRKNERSYELVIHGVSHRRDAPASQSILKP